MQKEMNSSWHAHRILSSAAEVEQLDMVPQVENNNATAGVSAPASPLADLYIDEVLLNSVIIQCVAQLVLVLRTRSMNQRAFGLIGMTRDPM